MDILDLIAHAERDRDFRDGEDQMREHAERDPDRKEWINEGFMRGYLQMSRMLHESIKTIALNIETEVTAHRQVSNRLMKEVKQLNDTLKQIHQTEAQLSINFESLQRRIEQVIVRQAPLLEALEKNAQP